VNPWEEKEKNIDETNPCFARIVSLWKMKIKLSINKLEVEYWGAQIDIC